LNSFCSFIYIHSYTVGSNSQVFIALTFDLARDPEWEPLITATSHLTGKKISRFTHIHQSPQDLLTRRELFRSVGGFDETHLGVAYNDVDFCLKLRERGYRIVYVPEAVLYHREGSSRGFGDRPEEEAFFKQV
jgi:GT2 family glycosyltransferase